MKWIVALFVVLLVFAGPAGGSGSGIKGRVTASPTCPVETMPPDPKCAPRGFAAHVRISRAGKVVKRLSTGGDGRFKVTLAPGRYRVKATPKSGMSLPSCPGPQAARVRSGHFTSVAIDCDSGIR